MPESNVVNFIELPKTNPASTKRDIVLMAESAIGEKMNGNKFFETAHGTFATVGDAEKFGNKAIRGTRWLVGERIVRDNGLVTYDFKSKPKNPRGFSYES